MSLQKLFGIKNIAYICTQVGKNTTKREPKTVPSFAS